MRVSACACACAHHVTIGDGLLVRGRYCQVSACVLVSLCASRDHWRWFAFACACACVRHDVIDECE